MQRLHALAIKIGSPLADLEKRIDAMLAHQKELEKALKSANQREAAGRREGAAGEGGDNRRRPGESIAISARWMGIRSNRLRRAEGRWL
jgi:hypothetical protein